MEDYIAIITAGGHISSFQAGIFGIVKEAQERNLGVIGFKDGFKGAKAGKYYVLNFKDIFPHIKWGGSIIGASREKVEKNLEKGIDDPKLIKENLEKLAGQGINVKGVIGMCGDDHLRQLYQLFSEEGIPVVGWPKTMDNDLSNTYFTLGYPTAAMNAAQSIIKGFRGAWTNSRIHIVTMFGRDTDWMVAAAGAWGNADLIIGGEKKSYDIKEIYEKSIDAAEQNKNEYGRRFAVVAVAEGADITGIESHVSDKEDVHGHKKLVPEKLALEIQKGFQQIDEKAPVSIDTLTYDTLRNCSPSYLDMSLANEAGEQCVKEIMEGNFGKCVVIKGPESIIHIKSGENCLGIEPLPDVFKKRYLALENFIDYDAMKVNPEFVEYYHYAFDYPKLKEEILFKKLEEMSI